MGCHPSKADFPQDAHSELFRPPAPIPVDIGSAVRHHLHKNSTAIVFIFGGPASQKGSIIEELTGSFNFTSISVEDIVFQYFPSRLSGSGTQIKDIQEALRNDEGMLSIDWVLEMISSRIKLTMNQRFVVDIVPAVSSILKAEEYRARSHDRQLNQFEMKHPISFAINVTVKDEQALTRLNGEANGKDADSKRINPELNQMMKGADDIDRGKLEKRIAEYHTCAEPFLQYFRKSNCVVSMSLSSEAIPNLVNTTRETLLKLGFTMTRKDDHIICFTTEASHDDIDMAYYKLKLVNAGELNRAGDSLASQIAAVHRFIASHSRHDDNFLVVVPSFKTQDTGKFKRINFMEKKKEVYLDEFIKNKQHDKPPKIRRSKASRARVDGVASSRIYRNNDEAKHLSALLGLKNLGLKEKPAQSLLNLVRWDFVPKIGSEFQPIRFFQNEDSTPSMLFSSTMCLFHYHLCMSITKLINMIQF